MQRMKLLQRHLISKQNRNPTVTTVSQSSCDVFINHRGIDTKRSIASLLYDRLHWYGINSFLDNKNMKPGDKLFEKINCGIMGCKVSVAVFSPRYCKSYFCLHELALIMESKKKMIPIFWDVKPSELIVVDNGMCPPNDIHRFNRALEEAKYTVGLTFDSSRGNWSDVVSSAANAVIESLVEIEDEERMQSERLTSISDRVHMRQAPIMNTLI